MDLFANAVPSRGIAHEAVLFPDQLRDFDIRNRQLLKVFGIAAVDCSGRGACDYYAGECYCDVAYFGPGCEFTYCKNDCSGHGKCDYISGTCICDLHYEVDINYGCKMKSLSLSSTLCQDEALDISMDAQGFRINPLYLSCYVGVKLGRAADSAYCVEGLENSLDVGTSNGCYTSIHDGSICADCSGFTERNITQLHLYLDEVCNSFDVLEDRVPGKDCNKYHTYKSVVRGLGALPSSHVTFHLDLFRAQNLDFSTFVATTGIVREFGGSVEEGGCGACSAQFSRCGANFKVLLDGKAAWESMVVSESVIHIDVRSATNLTLVTETYTPPNWYHDQSDVYGGGDAPAIATEPIEAVWCDGSAWVGARLI